MLVSAIPILQGGAELIVNRASASDLVDRLIGTDVSMVDVSAMALRVALPAPPEPDGRPSWFYGVRDDPGDPRIAMIRSPHSPSTLAARTVLARVIDNPSVLNGATSALRSHGWLPAGKQLAGGGRYLAETSSGESSRDVSSVADLAGVPAGSVVHVGLAFPGFGVAGCEATGTTCKVASLARGNGGFFQVASDPRSGETVIVQTSYPASNAPFRAVGRQVRDRGELAQALAMPWVSALLGWGQVLSVAYVDQDPALPIDRVWLAPLGFVLLSLLLIAGLRLGYPVFVIEATGRGAIEPAARTQRAISSSAIATSVSGRLARPRGGPLDVEGASGELRVSGSSRSGPVLLVRNEREVLEMALPAGGGSLTSLERGAVHWLVGSRPALWIHWFGSDARLVFANHADLARAEALLAPLV
jgi:hypothetical protein